MEVLNRVDASNCKEAVGFSVPYLQQQSEETQIQNSQNKKIRALRFEIYRKLYSMRPRGRSRSYPLQSLVHKLGRFKVRIIVISDADSKPER